MYKMKNSITTKEIANYRYTTLQVNRSHLVLENKKKNVNPKMTYRYYLRPSPDRTVKTVKRLIESGRLQANEIVSIRGTFSNKKWYRLTIRTRSQQFQFTSLSWFYYGTGSLALQQVLRWLLVPVKYQDAVIQIQHHGDNFLPNSFVIPAGVL